MDARGEFFAGRGDLGQVLGLVVAGRRGFGLLYVNIAEIFDVVPERFQARALRFATRSADGPMSTPRRPWPRSRGAPMMAMCECGIRNSRTIFRRR
jgi:hypothetical protein